MRIKSNKKWVLELGLLFAVVFAIGFWQTRHLLPHATPVSDRLTTLPPASLLHLDDQSVWQPEMGDRAVLLYFFAPWCQVCKWTINNLSFVNESTWWSRRAKVYAVALDFSDVDDVYQFKEDYDVKIPILLGTEAVREAFKVGAYPTYYFLKPDWQVATQAVGYTTRFGVGYRIWWAAL